MALQHLFTTDIGLLSLFTIGFIIAMAAYIFRFIKRNMEEHERGAGGET